jgi:beta-phosphoglucomutase-like phosphatase (HAD superfamily)
MKSFNVDVIHNYSALLFDLDGTLIDSMPTHNQAWIQAFQLFNAVITEEALYKLAGTPNLKTAEIFIKEHQVSATPHEVVKAKESFFEKHLQTIQKISATTELVYQFHQKIPLAIVSGGNKPRVLKSLASADLLKYFNVIITCEDTPRGKPFPDPFLLGAQLLKVDPKKCLVFEDGDAGIESAKKAEMPLVHVVNGQLFDLRST